MKINSTNATYKLSNKMYDQNESLNTPLLFNNLIWLTTKEAAYYLRKSAHALRQMTYKGIIRPRKIQGRLLFKKSELELLIDTSF